MTFDAWRATLLGEDALLLSGQHIMATECFETPVGMPYLTGPADFQDGVIRATKYVRDPKVVCEIGDILVTIKGSGTGKLVQSDRAYCISRQLAAVRPQSWWPPFVFHVLSSYQTQLKSAASGLIPGLSREDLLGLPVSLPPPSEQRKIAAILSSVDDAIEATQAVIDQLQVVKKAMMAELLTRGLPGRHTRFKQTEIGEVPEGWALSSIEHLGVDGEYVVRSGPFGSSMKTKDFRPSGVPVLTIQSLGEGSILGGGLFFVDEEKARELAEYKVRVNDLVFSRVADIGRCAAIGESETGWLISPNLSRIRLDPRKANTRFLMYLITMGEAVGRQVEMVAGNAGRPVISSTTLKQIRLPLPSLDEQRAIAAVGLELEHRATSEVEALAGLRSLKSALMSVLLTGELRVTPDQDPL